MSNYDDDDDDLVNPDAVPKHNSKPRTKKSEDVSDTGVAADELRQFVERIERLEEEKKAVAGDVKDVYAEAKARGFDTKAIRSIIKMRAMDPQERQEQEAILELYMQSLGLD